MKTAITELLNIPFPVVQAPIGSATTPALAAAVSNAGGLGMLALSWTDTDEMHSRIQETKKLTNKPFGVNLILEWEQSARVKICIEENVPLVSFAWGNSTSFIADLKSNGIKICHTVGSSKEALYYENAGVDFIVAQGWEAGGHVWGSVASSALIPSIADKVSIPIIAAGGFADGRGLLAALSLGASGIWMGSRFLMSKEANASGTYKELISKADENDTMYADRLFNVGWDFAPHRLIKNSTAIDWENAGNPEPGMRPGEHDIIGYNKNGEPLKRYSDNCPVATTTGNLEAMAIYAGQSVGLIKNEISGAGEIVHKIIAEAEHQLEYLKIKFKN